MAGIIKALTLFIALLGAWTLFLWFGIRLDAGSLSPLGLLVLHLLPPLAIWLTGWLLLRRWRRQRVAADEAAAAARRQEEAQAAEASRQRLVAELAQRRYGVPLLAAAFGGWLEAGGEETIVPGADRVSVLAADDAADAVDSLTEEAPFDDRARLTSLVAEALLELYSLCPGVIAFPLVVQAPADWALDEGAAVVRHAMAEAWLPWSEDWDGDTSCLPPAVRSLPAGSNLAGQLIGCFDADPRLPGLVVVAFDSPHARQSATDFDDELPPGEIERRRWQGQPAQGAIAVALANPGLGAMLAQVAAAQPACGEDDPAADGLASSQRPYWEAGNALPSHLLPLAALGEEGRKGLGEVVPLGFLHRTATGECAPRPGRVNQLADAARRAIERALVNAGLLPLPETVSATREGTAAEGIAEEGATEPLPPACDWLVHNAGGIDCAGQRLAALSLALHTFGIDVNPIDEATNFPARVGDLGAALPLALLAQAANKAAEIGGPACWVEFADAERFHVGFVAPAAEPLNALAPMAA